MNIIPNLPILHTKKSIGKFVFTQTYLYSHSSEKLGKNEIRLAYILNEKDLTTAAKLLKEGLKEYLSLKIKSFSYKNDELSLS